MGLEVPLRRWIERASELARETPSIVPALASLAVMVVLGAEQAGYPVTRWAPCGVILACLLAIVWLTCSVPWRGQPIGLRVAVAAFGSYTALCYLSILWASSQGDAWDGANRTLLYLVVFLLFVSMRGSARSALLLVGVWTIAMIVFALIVTLHLDTAGAARLHQMVPEGRLLYPSGYANANAAQWLMAFWPALLLARSRELHWVLRGILAGGALLLADVALLSQSRGSFYATLAMVVLVLLLLPDRTRTFAALLAIGAGLGATVSHVLAVGDHLRDHELVTSTLHSALGATWLASAALALLVAGAAAWDSRTSAEDPVRTRARMSFRVLGLGGLAVLVVALAVGVGHPIERVEHGWQTFKGGYGANSSSGSRLVSGLGSNRYDFYRVALDEFVSHPVLGIGDDNYQQQYLVHGRSDETPRYPHSVELKVLTETGLLGAALVLAGLAAALAVAARALRSRSSPASRLAAAAALAGFAYWAIHGSVDWLFEFAGLGAPAFALLGIACAAGARAVDGVRPGARAVDGVRPGARAVDGVRPAGRGPRRPRPALAAAAVLVLVAIASLAAPWLSQLDVRRAAAIWPRSPGAAYAGLDRAARLDPLSDEAYVIAGSIALRLGELQRANREFSRALARTPHDAYATLELGAIASTLDRGADARKLLRRAVALAPRVFLARQALETVSEGHRVDVAELNRSILRNAQQVP